MQRRRVQRRRSCTSCIAHSWRTGASLAEINPLVVTPNGDVIALDAKMSIDDNELDRLPKIAALRDDPPRSRAKCRPATRISRSSSSTATWDAS
jgi:succinyl-CoA synthetase beta subunit